MKESLYLGGKKLLYKIVRLNKIMDFLDYLDCSSNCTGIKRLFTSDSIASYKGSKIILVHTLLFRLKDSLINMLTFKTDF